MTKSDITLEDKKVKTGKFIVSYPALVKPKQFKDQEAKYSVTMLFRKDEDLSALKRAATNAGIEKFGKERFLKLKKSPKFIWPFRDGDVEKPDTEGYAGKIFIGASSKKKPQLVGPSPEREPIDEELEPGNTARAVVIAFAFDGKEKGGSNGISFALMSVQKLGEGKPISGRKDASEEFDDGEEFEEDEIDEDEESEDEETDEDEDEGEDSDEDESDDSDDEDEETDEDEESEDDDSDDEEDEDEKPKSKKSAKKEPPKKKSKNRR